MADVAETHHRLQAILEPHEATFVHTLEQAKAALASAGFDILIVGLHFAESRPFELIWHLASAPRPGLCVIAIRALSRQSTVTVAGFEIASKALGCAGFIDFETFAAGEAGDRQIRARIEELAAPRG